MGQSPAIAIIAAAGRFPGAPSLEKFWENLRDGKESVTDFSVEEVLATGIDPDVARAPNFVRSAGALDGIDLFDAGFFGVEPGEAEMMDPQHRLFLEVAWEALESAGYAPERCRGRIGVYSGASMSSYLLLNLRSHPGLLEAMGYLPVLIGTDKDYIPSRVSYKLNLRGPSLNVTSACSSSLVAVHLACQSLLNGETDMALAGGVAVATFKGYVFQEGTAFSPDGRCRAFDASSQGTFPGSAVGVLLLKPLEDAVKDRDPVLGVILGSAVNNDGSFKVSYSAPSMQGQEEVVREALALADVDASSIGYVEAHGTGTPLGDSIEVAALSNVFRSGGAAVGSTGLGSVKTNIGHTDAAAGVTALIKAVLCLQHRQLPPSLNFKTPNPKLDLERSPFYVVDSLRSWTGSEPLRAGVNSFGIGGTNAHIVLEEAPEAPRSGPGRSWQLLCLSARSAAALEASSERLRAHLERRPEVSLADVAYTLVMGRQAFSHRRIVVARDAGDAALALKAAAPGRSESAECPHRERRLTFVFGGTLVEPGTGRELHAAEAVFRGELDRAFTAAQELGLDLRGLLLAPSGQEAAVRARLAADPTLAAVAAIAVEQALARQLMAMGCGPAGVAGSGAGELSAACVAGVMTLAQAFRLAVGWSRQESSPSAGGPALKVPQIPLWSSARAAWVGSDVQSAAYWTASSATPTPPELLALLGQQADAAAVPVGLTFAQGPSGEVELPETARLMRTVGRLWLQGHVLGPEVFAGESRSRLALPTYPFERQRYWRDPRPFGGGQGG